MADGVRGDSTQGPSSEVRADAQRARLSLPTPAHGSARRARQGGRAREVLTTTPRTARDGHSAEGTARCVARLPAVRDPADYVLRWPSHIVTDELQRLVTLGEREGVSSDWLEEVDTLLRQAFATSVPAEDFGQLRAGRPIDPIYGDEEPF